MEQDNDAKAEESTRRRFTRPPDQWRSLIEAHRSSGLGVEAYCRQHGITSSCFYRWRRLLAGATGAASPWGGKKKRGAPAVGGFAAVRVMEDRREPSPSEPIRLRLAGGRELILPASLPTERLVDLLATLERGT